ncbi:uncharacterized protein [Amphiura filiformis]|uniref:uncharacterized protein n=1 Tax=Amphiura filiformis TaxID=82378 RepID=UPI003B20BD05
MSGIAASVSSFVSDESDPPLFDNGEVLGRSEFISLSDEEIPLTSPTDPGDKVADFKNQKGLNDWQTGFLLFGATVGTGIFVLPPCFAKAGYAAFFLFIVLLCQSHYCGVLLGRCWVMTKERNPFYRESHVRYPYAAIAYEAFGYWIKWLYIVIITVFTISNMAAILLVVSDLFVTVMEQLFSNLETSFCSVPPIMAAIIMPFMLLGTPNDFWLGGILGTLTTILATILVFCQTTIDVHRGAGSGPPSGRTMSTTALFSFIGTFFFAAESHNIYPTIQHDMANQKRFSPTLAASNIAVGLTFIVITIPTYIVYGDAMTSLQVESLMQVLPDGLIRLLCSMAMMPHFIVAIVVFANPLNQQMEELLDIPIGFCWQRCVIRGSLLFGVVFIAETVPHFGVLIPFVGGTLLSLMSLLGPPVFYLRLYPKQAFKYTWESRSVPRRERFICYFLIGITPLFIFTIIYTGIAAIVRDESVFTVPCYVNASQAHI